MHLKTVTGRLLNRFLASRNVKLVHSEMHGAGWDAAWDIEHYPESSRPPVPRYLNIGAGAWSHPLWHNLDHRSDWYEKKYSSNVHIEHDLMSGQRYPLTESSLAAVFTSHTIEHLRDGDVIFMFNEMYRCLSTGGFFRITCPDVDLYYDAYLRDDTEWWLWPNPPRGSNEQRLLRSIAMALTEDPNYLRGGASGTHPNQLTKKFSDQEVREIFSELPKEEAFEFFTKKVPNEVQIENPGFHCNWFNVEKVIRMLHEAGFEQVWESRYLQSKYLPLINPRFFDSTQPNRSLYVECQK